MEEERAPLLTVVSTVDPDEIREFTHEGDWVYFGRDPGRLGIALRDEPNSLSRIAGRIWQQWGQLWLANLSDSHDLLLQADHMPPEPPLPLRGADRPVHARTIPGRRCRVWGPTGTWSLIVEQDHGPCPRNLDTGVDYAAVGSVAARRAS